MGKKYTTFLTLFTVICITLTGCERENEQTANQGRLNLKLAVDTNVENMVTRATADEETLPDINDFSIAGQCKNLRGKFINCYLCLQIHSLWS